MPISNTSNSNNTNPPALLKDSINNLSGRLAHLEDLQDGVAEHVQAVLNQVKTLLAGQNEFPVDKEDLRKLENILQKDMPGLLDIYEKLPMTYRNEKPLKNNRTHRQNCIANLMLLSGIMLDIEDRTISQFDNLMSVQQHALREMYETDSLNLEEPQIIHNHPVHDEAQDTGHDVVQVTKNKRSVSAQTEVELETELEAENQDSNNNDEIQQALENILSPISMDDEVNENSAEFKTTLKNLEPSTVEAEHGYGNNHGNNSPDDEMDFFALGMVGELDELLFHNHKKLPIIKKGDALVDNFNWLNYKKSHPELSVQTMENTFVKPEKLKALENAQANSVSRRDKRIKAHKEKTLKHDAKKPGMMDSFFKSMNSFYRKVTFQANHGMERELQRFSRLIKSDDFTPEFPYSYHDKVRMCEEMLPRVMKYHTSLALDVMNHCIFWLMDSGSDKLHTPEIKKLAEKNSAYYSMIRDYDYMHDWWTSRDLEADEAYNWLFSMLKTGDQGKIEFAIYNTLRFNPAFLFEKSEQGIERLAHVKQYEYAAEVIETYYEDKEDEKYQAQCEAIKREAEEKVKKEEAEYLKFMKKEEADAWLEQELEDQLAMQEEIRELKIAKIKKNIADDEYGVLTVDEYDRKVHEWLYPDVDKNLFVNDRGQHFERIDDAIESLKYDLEKSQGRTQRVSEAAKQMGLDSNTTHELQQVMRDIEKKESKRRKI